MGTSWNRSGIVLKMRVTRVWIKVWVTSDISWK